MKSCLRDAAYINWMYPKGVFSLPGQTFSLPYISNKENMA